MFIILIISVQNWKTSLIQGQPFKSKSPKSSSSKIPPDPPKLQQKRVLIISEYRSGSSYVSEMFNQNPHAYYNFEPLIMLKNSINLPNSTQQQFQNQFLHKILNCENPEPEYFMDETEMHDVKNYLELLKSVRDFDEADRDLAISRFFTASEEGQPAKSQTSERRLENIINCYKFGICSYQRIKIFQKQPFCDMEKITDLNRLHVSKYCHKVPNSEINQLCRSKQIVAVKVIKLKRLEYAVQLLKKDPNLFIIYLVRDPRALVNSRFQVGKNHNFSDTQIFSHALEKISLENLETHKQPTKSKKYGHMNYICSRYEYNLKFFEKMKKVYRERLFLLRYEDVNLDLELTVNQIYRNFLGIEDREYIYEIINNMRALNQLSKLKVPSEDSVIDLKREENATQVPYRLDLEIRNLISDLAIP